GSGSAGRVLQRTVGYPVSPIGRLSDRWPLLPIIEYRRCPGRRRIRRRRNVICRAERVVGRPISLHAAMCHPGGGVVLEKEEGSGMKFRLLLAFILFLPAVVLADSSALILSGVPGSPDHAEKFAKWTEGTRKALVEKFGFSPERVLVLSDKKTAQADVWAAFKYASAAVERFYKEEGRLATEHPQISDNGADKTGATIKDPPLLARSTSFQVDRPIVSSDPRVQALLNEKKDLEQKIEFL